MRDDPRVGNSVSSDVTSKVSGLSPMNGRSRVRTCTTIRHATQDSFGWIYRRRTPLRFRTPGMPSMLTRRIGPTNRHHAREFARAIDGLCEGLFDLVDSWSVQMFGTNDVDMNDPAWAYILTRMKDGFVRGAAEIVRNGYQPPFAECSTTVIALQTLKADMNRLRADTAVASVPGIAEVAEGLEHEAIDLVVTNEMRKGRIANDILARRGTTFEETLDTIARSPVMREAFDAALHAVFGLFAGDDASEQFKRQHAQQTQRDAGPSHAASVSHPAAQTEPAEANATTQPAPIFEPRKPFGAGDAASEPVSEATPPADFLGRPDRRLVPRAASTWPLLSEAAVRYFAKREEKRKLEPGASLPLSERPELKNGNPDPALVRDIRTARMRCKVFIDLIGDHPIDTYDREDFRTFIHLLRFYEPNAADRAEMSATNARSLLEANYAGPNAPPLNRPMALKTVKNGYVGGIRPIIRFIEQDGTLCDPLQNKPLEYPSHFPRSKPAEPISGAKMQAIVRGGLKERSLALAMLPLVAFLTTRRLGAIVPLRGTDIYVKYEAISDGERDVYVAGFDDPEDRKHLHLKTEASRCHYVLHSFLEDIGFLRFAQSMGDTPIFSRFQHAADPNSLASKRINALLKKHGCSKREVFHSTRGDGISFHRAAIRVEQAVIHQSGHAPRDEHDRYGTVLSEAIAYEFATAEVPRWLETLRDELTEADFAEMYEQDARDARLHRKARSQEERS